MKLQNPSISLSDAREPLESVAELFSSITTMCDCLIVNTEIVENPRFGSAFVNVHDGFEQRLSVARKGHSTFVETWNGDKALISVGSLWFGRWVSKTLQAIAWCAGLDVHRYKVPRCNIQYMRAIIFSDRLYIGKQKKEYVPIYIWRKGIPLRKLGPFLHFRCPENLAIDLYIALRSIN